jgi:hypothetical protein
MIHPEDTGLSHPLAVRDGRDAPVTCAACGCRLQGVGPRGNEAWFHFRPIAGRDARGDRVDCADAAHDALGNPVAVLVS